MEKPDAVGVLEKENFEQINRKGMKCVMFTSSGIRYPRKKKNECGLCEISYRIYLVLGTKRCQKLMV